jgi:hypothetical protein
MRVLQVAKRSVALLATLSVVALAGCGDSGPDVPFNPTGTSTDIEAVNAAFGSSTFASFSSLSVLFDAAYGAPLVSASAAAMDIRASGAAGMRAAAIRSAQRLAGLLPGAPRTSFSAPSATISAAIAGKTFEYSGGTYVAGVRTGAPANGVRFLLYAVDPVTFAPVEPLVETGYVDITDLSGSSTQAARVQVVSGGTTYLDYTVTASNLTGTITVVGFVTDGTYRANVNLRASLSSAGALTLVYGLDVPQRDVSIDLTMTMTGLDTGTPTININLTMSGPNGTVSLSGQFTSTGGTLTVRTGGRTFATITVTGTAEPVITGADGLPITQEDAAALIGIFELTTGAFISFDQMLAPVTFFLVPAA